MGTTTGQTGGEDVFRFSDLHAELREAVYEFYFTGTTISPAGHPKTKHGTALLQVNRQIRSEALAWHFKTTKLVLHLDKKYAPNPGRDRGWLLDNVSDDTDLCSVARENFVLYKNVS